MKRFRLRLRSVVLVSLVATVTCSFNAAARELLVTSHDNHRVLRYDGLTGDYIDIFANGGGLNSPIGLTCPGDGNLYVAGNGSSSVLRYNAMTGDFIDVFASGGGLDGPEDLVFGPDGNLYVASFENARVLRYDGESGAFIDTFASGGGLDGPAGLVFGPDGNLYVSSYNNNRVLRYNGETGAFIDTFADSGGLNGPEGVIFGPDGSLYVSSFHNDRVLRYDGTTGAFVDVFATGGGLRGPVGTVFGPDGNFYVAGWNSSEVYRYDGTSGSFMDVFARGGGLDTAGYLAFCNTSGFRINTGLNDAWYNQATSGQGFFIIVLPDTGIIFMAWFTYDTERPPEDVMAILGEPGHRWLTAQGPFAGDTATLDVYRTHGGVFDMAEPQPVTDQEPIGTITIVWQDCEHGTVTYHIDPPGVSGVIPITRIVSDNVARCEALNEQ